MEPEIEAKWLDIDLDAFRSKLLTKGARLVYPERLMIRKNRWPEIKFTEVPDWLREKAK